MAYIRLPLGVKIAVEYDWNNKLVVNVYHVTTTDPITTVHLVDIATAFRDTIIAGLLGFLADEISLVSITALNLNEPNGERIVLGVTPPSPGLYVGQSVSNNVASVASLKTALTGRSFQGRSYIPGVPEQEVAQNELSALIATGIITWFTSLEAALAIENTELVVASFQTLLLPRGEGVATPVDSVHVNLRVDTQRRRLPAV